MAVVWGEDRELSSQSSPLVRAPGTSSRNSAHRQKVQETLEDIRPALPHHEVEARFAKRRAAALREAEGHEP